MKHHWLFVLVLVLLALPACSGDSPDDDDTAPADDDDAADDDQCSAPRQ